MGGEEDVELEREREREKSAFVRTGKKGGRADPR